MPSYVALVIHVPTVQFNPSVLVGLCCFLASSLPLHVCVETFISYVTLFASS